MVTGRGGSACGLAGSSGALASLLACNPPDGCACSLLSCSAAVMDGAAAASSGAAALSAGVLLLLVLAKLAAGSNWLPAAATMSCSAASHGDAATGASASAAGLRALPCSSPAETADASCIIMLLPAAGASSQTGVDTAWSLQAASAGRASPAGSDASSLLLSAAGLLLMLLTSSGLLGAAGASWDELAAGDGVAGVALPPPEVVDASPDGGIGSSMSPMSKLPDALGGCSSLLRSLNLPTAVCASILPELLCLRAGIC